MLHLVYTAHGSEADFERIEPDLDGVARQCARLVLVVEDVLPPALLRQCLDPSLGSLPSDVLFDSRTPKRNREEFARAYDSAVGRLELGYQAWNAVPVPQKQTIFGEMTPYNRRLFAWAAAHGVEIVRGETSLEAWLAQNAWHLALLGKDAGVSRGEPATVWAANREEYELLARAIRLRDAEIHAQLTRLVRVERRGHGVLYVVGALHSVNQELLVGDLEAVVHERRFFDPFNEPFVAALIEGSFDQQPAAVREQIETFAFLGNRLRMLARPTTSWNDVAQMLREIERAALSRSITLRQIVDHIITAPDFHDAARPHEGFRLRWLVAYAFITHMVNGAFLPRSVAEKHLDFSPPA